MPSNPNYFDVLDVRIDASTGDIRTAYLAKARLYHPDSPHSANKKHLVTSDELIKGINQAYEVLLNSKKRERYKRSLSCDQQEVLTPVVESVGVNISNATPGVTYTGYLIMRNMDGPYSKLKAAPGVVWIRLISLRPLTAGIQLPLRVDIELEAGQWSSLYQTGLAIGLNEAAVTVPVTIQIRQEPKPNIRQADDAIVEANYGIGPPTRNGKCVSPHH